MPEQLELVADEATLIHYPDGFWRWLRANRNVYREFEKLALRMAQSRPRYSARTIVEVMRWNTDLSDTDNQFKINGNFVPGMARFFMERHGRNHPGFFKLRDSLGR